MLNADAQLFVSEPLFSATEYKTDLLNPNLNLERDTRIVHAPDGSVAAIAELHQRAPWVHPFIWVRTALDARNHGLGCALLTWGVDLATSLLGNAPGGSRVTLGANAIAGNQAAARLLNAHGFQHVRNFLQMRIDMQDESPPNWPEGITVRTFRPHVDDVALYHAKEDAFVDHWGHVARPFAHDFPVWQKQLHADPLFDPTLYHLAMAGDEIAGFSLCMAPVPGELHGGWIHLLGVRRPWRRRGLGHALLLHSFAEFYARDVKRVGLGVDAESLTGATRLYVDAGMHVQHTTEVYEMELRSGDNPSHSA